jgi:ABC-type lipoprotein export system ATPase subunit
MMADRKNIINCANAGLVYKMKGAESVVLKDINIQIGSGEKILIVGKSGAGKSSLMRIMSGLEKCTSGSVRFFNKDLNQYSASGFSKVIAEKTGFIFQNFNLIPCYTIYENLYASLFPLKSDKKECNDLIRSHLTRFNLENKINHYPSQLSIGQQQKISLIRAVMKKPSIIFADEPTGSLDNESANDLQQFLTDFCNELHSSLVICSHGNISEIKADRTITIHDGMIQN